MTHPVRRHDREVTEPAEIEAILRDGRWVTIGLADGAEPYVVTLSYGYDADRRRLCFHAASKGRKLDIIARNPRACATVVRDLGYNEGACEQPFESVVMTGTMRVLTDVEESRVAMRTLATHLEGAAGAHAVWERNGLDSDSAFRLLRVLVFDIDSVSAKRGK